MTGEPLSKLRVIFWGKLGNNYMVDCYYYMGGILGDEWCMME